LIYFPLLTRSSGVNFHSASESVIYLVDVVFARALKLLSDSDCSLSGSVFQALKGFLSDYALLFIISLHASLSDEKITLILLLNDLEIFFGFFDL
jgi:hypothetical protein